MNTFFDLLHPVLHKYDIESFKQNGTSLAEIEMFRRIEHSVLFGVKRFWTGVDFPGSTLSQLIIVRLPNRPLSDPLMSHRKQQSRRTTFWNEVYYPTCRLELKQGFGRLIRNEKDKGLFVLLDKRTSKYDDTLPVHLHRKSNLRTLIPESLKHIRLSPEFKMRGVDLREVIAEVTRRCCKNFRECPASCAFGG